VIRSDLRQRVSSYLLAVELLVTTLRDCLPVLRDEVALLPEPKKTLLTRLLDRLETVLVRVEKMSNEEESS
jgi:hypothetical protein